ncbi:MAG: hypothetical protein R3F62_04615 [Planctomycetota bacterium]
MFESPQVRPFAEELAPPPLDARAGHDGERLVFQVGHPDYAFLAQVLAEPAPTLAPAEPEEQALWDRALECVGDEHATDFVRHAAGAKAFPREVVALWPDNAAYAYELWRRQRDAYEPWLEQVAALEEGLPSEVDWSAGPEERALRSLEHALRRAIPARTDVLRRLFALGILAPEDGGRRLARLEALGLGELARWRRASLLHREVAPCLDGMWPGRTQLGSPVGVEWFLDGPYQQRHLDPLTHLAFALKTHLDRRPPEQDGSVVISVGGRISGAFFHQLGPGGVPQLVAGGEPVPRSALHAGYPHGLSAAGDRCAELAARAIRGGRPRWGGALALRWLELESGHGQCWVELGVALERLGRVGLGRACLGRAEASGLAFGRRGELAALWAAEAGALPPLSELAQELVGWEDELRGLEGRERVAVCLSDEVLGLPGVRAALASSGLPPALARCVSG